MTEPPIMPPPLNVPDLKVPPPLGVCDSLFMSDRAISAVPSLGARVEVSSCFATCRGGGGRREGGRRGGRGGDTCDASSRVPPVFRP